MKKWFGLMFSVFLFLLIAGWSATGVAEVNVNVGVGVFAPPPPFRVPAPPPVVVIPGTYIYMVPDIDVDIFFSNGHWFRPFEGRWYRSKSYNGPWRYIEPRHVPRGLVDLPPGYRHIPPGHQKIPYGHLKKNWGRWERERYWDRDDRWREGRRNGPPPGPLPQRRFDGPDRRGPNPRPHDGPETPPGPPRGPGDRRFP